MQHEITRLTNLLHEFRSVSRRQTFSFQPLNLVAVIQELLAVETPHYTERGVQVEHVMPDDLPQVQADPDKLKQVCLNLCKNAVEAMPAGGRLTLRAHAAAEHVHLEVIDTGNGIPEGVNILEPFATTKAEGTGLGLPIVQQIITGHGGTLSYTSTPGQGTTFTVILPLSPPRATP
jgi:signal transduction histidine kinase